jgi:hypothetical protein
MASIPRQTNLVYSGVFDMTGTFLFRAFSPYTISGGGADIGTFNAQANFPLNPLTWTNMPAIGSRFPVNRSNGYTVTWTGGDPDGRVLISTGYVMNSALVSFTCVARTTDGAFTVPPNILLALPQTTEEFDLTFSWLSVRGISAQVPFSAPGLDLGLAMTVMESTYLGVAYQ